MSRNYNDYEDPYDYDEISDHDYEYDSDRYPRPEERLRARFEERQRRSDFDDPYSYQAIDDTEGPIAGRTFGCQPWMTRAALTAVVIVALFRGGIFEGAVSISRRGCTLVIWAVFLGVAFFVAAYFLYDSNTETALGLGICGSVLCLGSILGVFGLIAGGVSLAFAGDFLDEEEGGDGGLLGGIFGGFLGR